MKILQNIKFENRQKYVKIPETPVSGSHATPDSAYCDTDDRKQSSTSATPVRPARVYLCRKCGVPQKRHTCTIKMVLW